MTVFIADANSEYRNKLINEFKRVNIHTVGISDDGTQVVEQIQRLMPDIVLIDVVLPGLDGISVLRNISKIQLQKKPIIIVTSSFISDELEHIIADLGAQFFIAKPFNFNNLLFILRYISYSGFTQMSGNESSKLLIAELLKEMGMPAHIKGFRYSQEAVEFMINSFKENNFNTKPIYSHVAKIFSTTPACAERSIRHAIEVAWLRGDIQAHYRLFRNSVSCESGKPTNYEFITTLADKVLAQTPPIQNEY